MISAPAFRFFGALADLHWMAWFVLPFANCDSLALGALLAYVVVAERHTPLARRNFVRAAWWVGTPLVLALWFLEFNHISTPMLSWARTAFENTAWAVFFVWLVDRTARGVGGPVGRLLQLRPMTYLGRISYGLYVCHPFMVRVVPWAFARAGFAYPTTRIVEVPTLVVATILVAAFSWHFYERPLNNLKRHLVYA